MNIALSDTILYVTGKQGIENTTQQELQTMVAEYPYFAPAQLVFAAKLKSENSFKLQTQVQKAGLFFNNFKWLQYQLLEAGVQGFSTTNGSAKIEEKINATTSVAEVEEATVPVIVEQVLDTPLQATQDIIVDTPNEVVVETSSIPAFEQYDVAETIASNAHQFMPNLSIPTVEDVKGIMNGIDEKPEETVPEIVTAHEENIIKEMVDNKPVEIVENVEITNFVVDTFTANNEQSAAVVETNNINAEEEIIETPVANDIHAEIAALKANWYSRNESEKLDELFNHNKAILVEEVIEAPQLEKIETKLESNIAILKSDWNAPLKDAENATLSFETEPYYTIDYFASQGIKFDYTKEPQDKLTAKMLKFTDWLKKMKSPKQEYKAPIDEDPELDIAIQNIAATSNQSKEVVTETMAEIFAKQGKTDKAIQLYIKLSFLIPHKSAYFATKLNELKGI